MMKQISQTLIFSLNPFEGVWTNDSAILSKRHCDDLFCLSIIMVANHLVIRRQIEEELGRRLVLFSSLNLPSHWPRHLFMMTKFFKLNSLNGPLSSQEGGAPYVDPTLLLYL